VYKRQLEEGSPASTPATFVAGVFGDDTGELHIRQPVTAPDWLCLRLLVEGMPLNLMNGEIIEPVSYTHLDVYKRQLP